MKRKEKSIGGIYLTMMNLRSRLNAPEKMIVVNDQFGNRNIKNQQSTSRVIYDSLPPDGRTIFEFFKSVSAHPDLPFSNISENKLQVGESLTIRRLYFCVLTFDSSSGAFTGVTDLTTAGLPEFYGGDYSTKFDTMTVAKPNPLSSQLPAFSKNSNHSDNEWIWLDNDAVIIPNVQFQVNLEVPPYTPVANAQVRLVMEGFGSLLSPKGQF
jgi:hypothetical protein